MSRSYRQTRRAESQAETRRRIVEATVDLHSEIGPAATTVSMVAERAGVQRHTVYAHFPDELSLHMACSGLAMERDPLPDPEPWRAIADPRQRLLAALSQLYAWFSRNAQLMACVLRDMEVHAATRAVTELRMGPALETYRQVLGAGLSAPGRAMLHLAMSYFTWRTLTREGGLSDTEAVQAMADAAMAETVKRPQPPAHRAPARTPVPRRSS